MNILLHKKDRIITSIIFAIVFVVILVLGFKLNVFSGSPEPEGRTFDSTGLIAKSTFLPQEHGYITIKAYRVNISPSSTVPSQMNFYIKQPSGMEIGFDSKTGMGIVTPANVTKVDGILYVPVQISSTETGDYVNLKLAVTYTSAGVFDALSNYTNCDSGQVQKLSEISRVEYINESSSALVQKSTLSPLCVKVVRNSLQVIKTTYLDSAAGVDIAKLADVQALAKTANFEAGNKIVVVLEIDELDASRSDFKINDLIPDKASGDINYAYNFSGGVAKNSATTKGSGTLVFYGDSTHTPSIGPLIKGKNYIIYRYKI